MEGLARVRVASPYSKRSRDQAGANFRRLDPGRPEIAILMDALLRGREVVAARSWSTSHEPTSENWWADVLADPRARIRRQPRGFYGRDGGERLGNPITGLQTSPVQ
jgi:hypothetical protein